MKIVTKTVKAHGVYMVMYMYTLTILHNAELQLNMIVYLCQSNETEGNLVQWLMFLKTRERNLNPTFLLLC